MTSSGSSAESSSTPARVLIIDAANVIGARPDGWWKDRAGAGDRLHRALAHATLPYDLVVVVLEGRARTGVPESEQGLLQVVHASGSGDDALVEYCREYAGSDLTLVTADRGLIARVADLGVVMLGPRTLRDRIGL